MAPGRAGVGGAQQGLPPRQSPGTPAPVQAGEAQGGLAGAVSSKLRRRRVVQRRDAWPGVTVVSGDQVQGQIAQFGGQAGQRVRRFGIVLHLDE